MNKWLKRLAKLVGLLILVMFLLTEPWSWMFGQPWITVSKETTYFTEPLRPDGLVDYPAIINAKQSAGVTPETNAVTLLIRLVPKEKWQPGQLAATCKAIGIDVPKEEPVPIVDFERFFREHVSDFPRCQRLNDSNLSEESECVYQNAFNCPVDSIQFPGFSDWIKTNEAALKIAVEASRRRDYYEPTVLQDYEESVLLASYPVASALHDAALALVFRASMRAARGQLDEAQEDLLNCERLSALCERGPNMTHSFSAYGGASAASEIWPVVAFFGKPTKQHLLKMADTLDSTPRFPNVGQKINIYERVACLDSIQKLSPLSAHVPNKAGNKWEYSSLKRFLTDATNNWNAASREVNAWMDELVTATSDENPSQRAKHISEFDKRRSEKADAIRHRWGIVWYVVPRTVRGRMIGEKVAVDEMFITKWVATKQVQMESRREIARLSLALLRYREENGRFPDKLASLLPAFLKSLPIDYESGESIEYQQIENGFRLSRLGPEWMRKESGHDIELYRLPKTLETSNVPPPEPEEN